ncbi:ABC transporter ATP-binding protein [Microbacterium nanhaiense]|uniref:ABC transporter ATP-binding protein n=1 Tax=Microbacterium nanhaiense TaxID=1301026 RepID=A0ABQ2N3X6_9MICO|nr:ATP-binding cassette domain-containing protein [Microbacterium nanhaiense]GGO67517.1 ABC transporter ATP-binding protein [Microbacterium nanhaiense]
MSENLHPDAGLDVLGLSIVSRGSTLLDNVDVTVSPGEVHAIVGPSGAGKTTLLHALAGLVPSGSRVSGSVTLHVESEKVDLLSLSARALRRTVAGRVIGVAVQAAGGAFSPVRPIRVQLREAISIRRTSPHGPGHPHLVESRREALADLGHAAGIEPEWLDRYPHELSGGQLTRLGLIAAIANHPPILLADEPTTGLDAESAGIIGALLAGYAASGHAVLVASHDTALVSRIAARVTHMRDGRIVAAPTETVHVSKPARAHASTGQMLVQARGVGVRRGGAVILDGVDLELRAGEVVALTGPSGAGKSTLARILAQLEAPTSGMLEISGRPVTAWGIKASPDERRRTAWLSQHPHQAVDPRLTLRRVIELPARLAGHEVDADELAARFGLGAQLLSRTAKEVSGGQLQRALVARALALSTPVIIADEVTSMLDDESAMTVLAALRDAADAGAAVLLIGHEASRLARIAARYVHLQAGGKLHTGSQEHEPKREKAGV